MRIGANPVEALGAYNRIQNQGAGEASGVSASFGDVLGQAVQGVIDTGHQADAQAAMGISGHGDLTQVVMAVSRAQLALQSTTAIRDRVVQAYQDVMKMAI